MRKGIFFVCLFSLVVLFSCKKETTPVVDTPAVEESAVEPAPKPEETVQKPVEKKVEVPPEPPKPVEKKEEPKPKEEPKVEPPPEPPKPVEEPEPEPPKPEEKGSEEYKRSVADVKDVTEDEFTKDKKAVIEVITKLDRIMENSDFNGWLNYIDKNTRTYYSSSSNLNKVTKRLPPARRAMLPNKKLVGIKDYFTHVFLPSRQGFVVNEIRYINKDYIKAVDAQEDGTDVVYYYFNKVDGKWLVHIPPVTNN